MPSYLPPANWVSRWLPISTGGRWSSVPGRRAKMLPTRSTATVQPASVHQVMKRSRISLSASVRARRRRPPALPGPISPERMTVDQKRGASIVIESDADMVGALPARSGLTARRESLSTALTAAGDRPICGHDGRRGVHRAPGQGPRPDRRRRGGGLRPRPDPDPLVHHRGDPARGMARELPRRPGPRGDDAGDRAGPQADHRAAAGDRRRPVHHAQRPHRHRSPGLRLDARPLRSVDRRRQALRPRHLQHEGGGRRLRHGHARAAAGRRTGPRRRGARLRGRRAEQRHRHDPRARAWPDDGHGGGGRALRGAHHPDQAHRHHGRGDPHPGPRHPHQQEGARGRRDRDDDAGGGRARRHALHPHPRPGPARAARGSTWARSSAGGAASTTCAAPTP